LGSAPELWTLGGIHTMTDQPTSLQAPQPSSRPVVFVAFLVCFAWLYLYEWLIVDYVTPSLAPFFAGLLVPIFSAFAILYRSRLFREVRRGARVGALLLTCGILLFIAFVFHFIFALVLFGFGVISPD
jgi:hypothetical protein